MPRVLAALVVLATVAVTGASEIARDGPTVVVALRPARSLVTRVSAPGGMLLMRTDTNTLVVAPVGTAMRSSEDGRMLLTIPDPEQHQTRGWDTTTAQRALDRLAAGEDIRVVANSSPEPPAAVPSRQTNVACVLDRRDVAVLTMCVERVLLNADDRGNRYVRTAVFVVAGLEQPGRRLRRLVVRDTYPSHEQIGDFAPSRTMRTTTCVELPLALHFSEESPLAREFCPDRLAPYLLSRTANGLRTEWTGSRRSANAFQAEVAQVPNLGTSQVTVTASATIVRDCRPRIACLLDPFD